jgi:transcriptional regulator with XRE-family HTH domain
MTTLADRVRELRVAAGLSQTALAGDSLSPSYVSLIESGRREPTDAALRMLAQRLETTPEYLRHGEDGPHEARLRLELDLAQLDLVNGDPARARDRLLTIDMNAIAPTNHVEALLALARAHEALGDLEESVAVLEPLLAATRRRGQLLDSAAIATQLVASYLEAGDVSRSVELGNEVLEELDDAGLAGTDEQLRLASTVLWAYVERGDILYATHSAAKLIREADEFGTPRGRGSVYWNAALVAEERRDYVLAQRYTARALALLGEGEPSRDLPRLRLNYAWLLNRSEPPEAESALAQLELAYPHLVASGSEVELAYADVERSRAHLLLGDVVAAEADALAALERLGDKPRLDACGARLALGDALFARGDAEGATREYRWAADMLGMMSVSRRSAAVWRELGDRFLTQQDVAGAAQAFDRALQEAGFRPVPSAVTGLTGGMRR